MWKTSSPYTAKDGKFELLFKQLKQNFPLRYFYGESANAIKIQILGYPNSQYPFDGHTKAHQTLLELFRIGYNGKDHAYVLRELLYFL